MAPNPRYRLYTSLRSYTSIFLDKLRGRLNTGDDVEALEGELARFLGTDHVVCVPQNRVGIYLVLKHLLKSGQEVVMSPYTIADITNMVILAGGRPVFADVDRETCNISRVEVEKSLTENTGAVLITHLHGLAAMADEIRDICDEHNLPLIEDTAQGFGAELRGVRLGTWGKAGVFSFGSFKNVNAWLGGAICSNDADLADSIRKELSNFGYQRHDLLLKKVRKGLLSDIATYPPIFKLFTFWIFRHAFLHDIEAINRKVRTELDVSRKTAIPADYLARMTPGQARLARSQLGSVDKFSGLRKERAKMYHEGLSDLAELIVPPFREDYSHIYTYYPIQYQNRDDLLKYLMRHKRDIAAQHYGNNAELPGFEEFHRECPNASAVAEQLIFLPTYPTYPKSEVEKNIEVIQHYFRNVT